LKQSNSRKSNPKASLRTGFFYCLSYNADLFNLFNNGGMQRIKMGVCKIFHIFVIFSIGGVTLSQKFKPFFYSIPLTAYPTTLWKPSEAILI